MRTILHDRGAGMVDAVDTVGTVDAVVLAGGAARRLDGADKPALVIGDRSLLDHVLAAVPPTSSIVVVGPERPVQRTVQWCREEPPGSGPVAALAAGLPHVHTDVVLVLAADLPAIGTAIAQLCAALDDAAGCAVLVTDGRRNYLAAAWRRRALVAALDRIGQTAGAAMRQLYADVTVREVLDTTGAGRDVDTWPDVETARARVTTDIDTSTDTDSEETP